MQFYNFLLSTAILATGTVAASVPRQADPHVVDFRIYGQPGCSEDNQGVWTLTESQSKVCYGFSTPVASTFIVDINAGCSVYVYTDTLCAVNQVIAPVGIEHCYSSTASLGSFQVVC